VWTLLASVLAKLHLQQVTCSLAMPLYWPRVNRPLATQFHDWHWKRRDWTFWQRQIRLCNVQVLRVSVRSLCSVYDYAMCKCCEFLSDPYVLYDMTMQCASVASFCQIPMFCLIWKSTRLATGWTEWERFSVPVETDHGAHPASWTMVTGSFQGVKQSGRGANHPPTSSTGVANGLELYLRLPSLPA